MSAGGGPRRWRPADERDLDDVLSAFARAEIPAGGFGHAGHLAVAFGYLEGHALDAATERMRRGLLRFLRRQLGDETAARVRYRETLTVFWMRLVASARDLQDPTRPRLERFLEVLDRYGDPGVVYRFYSQERLDDPEARERFLEPDLAPLPGPPP